MDRLDLFGQHSNCPADDLNIQPQQHNFRKQFKEKSHYQNHQSDEENRMNQPNQDSGCERLLEMNENEKNFRTHDKDSLINRLSLTSNNKSTNQPITPPPSASPSPPQSQHQQEQQQHRQTGHSNEIDNTEIFECNDNDKRYSQNTENDDEAFIALCTDSSSVLNNDPTRRYYINKLYQPLTSQQDSLVEHDDEYLLYQELRYIESTAQELNDERERVQLTKILEDDDGDDEQLGDDDRQRTQREDPLDRLQLTTIIESFNNSFSPSPMIDSCQHHGRDPLICQTSDQSNEKPDSTGPSSDDSPMSCDYGNGKSDDCGHVESISNNYLATDDHNQSYQSMTNNIQMDLRNDHDGAHFLSSNTHESHQHEDQTDHIIDNQQACNNQDNTSEISCFQQVSSTFMSPTTNMSPVQWESESVRLTHLDDSSLGTNQDGASSNTNYNHESCAKRRNLEENDILIQDSRICLSQVNEPQSNKRRRLNNNEQADGSQMENNETRRTSLNSNETLTITLNNLKQQSKTSNNQMNSYTKTNEYHKKHINPTTRELNDEINEEFDSNDLESGGRNPPMNKYRRRTANARERIRMREINQAFEKLKKVVPIELIQQSASGDESDQTSISRRGAGKSSSSSSQQDPVKLTKINTLRLAVSYIAKLTEVLNQSPEGSQIGSIDRNSSNSRTTILDGDSSQTSRIGAKQKDRPVRDRRRGRSTNKKCVGQLKRDSSTPAIPEKSTSAEITATKQATQFEEPGQVMSTKLVEPTAIVINQQNDEKQPRQQQILISNGLLNRGLNQQATFIPIQQQNAQKQQFAYAPNQHPLVISQPAAANNQERTFVTPVAVAILGIPTPNGQPASESQSLQLLGIQNALQSRQQATIQTNPSYNLITPQPHQVTLTLDDINGLSVLRLANPQNGSINPQQALQLQPGRQIIQQPQFLTTAGYNYAYQPIQISQVQSPNLTTIRPVSSQPTTIQMRNGDNNLTFNSVSYANVNGSNHTPVNNIGNNQQIITNPMASSSPATSTTTTVTGINSDCGNFSISPSQKMIAQQMNNANNVVQTVAGAQQQFKYQQQTNSQLQTTVLKTNHHDSITATPSVSTQIFQDNNTMTNGTNALQIQNKATTSLVYINQPPPTTTSITTTSNHNHDHNPSSTNAKNDQKQQSFQASKQMCESEQQYENQIEGQPGNQRAPFGQIKFVSQFTSQVNQTQEKNFQANEANISQLVASLATSIHPNPNNSGEKGNPSAQISGETQKQQPKRTYRFHNYDGNMITNHLYNNNSNNDKQNQQQSTSARGKSHNQAQIQTGANVQIDRASESSLRQRSRQNSLSSTCSTTSSSSSSLGSLSASSTNNGSPANVPVISIMVKSPAFDRNNTNSSNSALVLLHEPETAQTATTVGGS